jgi:hypothetical protein
MKYRLKQKYFNVTPAKVRTTLPISSKVSGEVVYPNSQGICNIAPLPPCIQFILGDYRTRCYASSCSIA